MSEILSVEARRALALEAVAYMESAFAADPQAIRSLIVNRVPVNDALRDHPHVICEPSNIVDGCTVGAAGLLNGFLCRLGVARIGMQFDDKVDPQRLVGFQVYPEPDGSLGIPELPAGVIEVRVVVAAANASGEPDFYFCKVRCRQEQYDDGQHYEAAHEQASEEGYEGAMVEYDENDPPKPLFSMFEWASADVIDISRESSE